MRKPIIIGNKNFQYKKDALNYYKAILNSYQFGQSLNDEDYNDLFDLIKYDEFCDEEEECEEIEGGEIQDIEEDIFIEDIKVSKVQFSTKCFEVILSDSSSYYISYLMIINRHNITSDSVFNTACRNAINNDLILVKQQYFKENAVKDYVKCQETNEMSKWEDLVVDHRQPNTFSVIVDRFKEVFSIDTSNVDYLSDENNFIVFRDKDLSEKFRNYHKAKANLRIVKKECNSSRAGMARLKRSSKDLTIK